MLQESLEVTAPTAHLPEDHSFIMANNALHWLMMRKVHVYRVAFLSDAARSRSVGAWIALSGNDRSREFWKCYFQFMLFSFNADAFE
jgi:hypothetical protein